jgi:hypothetical protein
VNILQMARKQDVEYEGYRRLAKEAGVDKQSEIQYDRAAGDVARSARDLARS